MRNVAGARQLPCYAALASNPRLVHRLISGRHTAVGDFADFQGASDEHISSKHKADGPVGRL